MKKLTLVACLVNVVVVRTYATYRHTNTHGDTYRHSQRKRERRGKEGRKDDVFLVVFFQLDSIEDTFCFFGYAGADTKLAVYKKKKWN